MAHPLDAVSELPPSVDIGLGNKTDRDAPFQTDGLQ